MLTKDTYILPSNATVSTSTSSPCQQLNMGISIKNCHCQYGMFNCSLLLNMFSILWVAMCAAQCARYLCTALYVHCCMCCLICSIFACCSVCSCCIVRVAQYAQYVVCCFMCSLLYVLLNVLDICMLLYVLIVVCVARYVGYFLCCSISMRCPAGLCTHNLCCTKVGGNWAQ